MDSMQFKRNHNIFQVKAALTATARTGNLLVLHMLNCYITDVYFKLQ